MLRMYDKMNYSRQFMALRWVDEIITIIPNSSKPEVRDGAMKSLF
jgi:hypothetical protein